MKRILTICATMMLVLFLLSSIPVVSAETVFKPVAEEMTGSSGITWLPKLSYECLQVTLVRPDGTILQKTFRSGGTPYLNMTDILGPGYSDGLYSYELRIIADNFAKSRENIEKAGFEQDGSVQEGLTQSGTFMILGGVILSASSEEISRTMDVVHADDVIITGSQCTGFDCLTDGTENFGLDTIRLKENSLRIHFDDTSTSAGFPANDWRIVANDSTSGGANYLAFEDTTGSKTPFKVTAGARSNAIFVSSGSKVGFGTSAPLADLHMVNGNTPTMRLDQDGSYGWSPQVWDVGGNESNLFIRDVTGGSKLPFRIQPGTPTNTLTLRSDGYVGIGTWAPGYPLEVETSDENAVVLAERIGGAACYMNATTDYGNFGTTTAHPVRLVASGTWQFSVDSNCDISMRDGGGYNGTWNDASSRALKENIHDLSTEDAMETLAGLTPVTYNYKSDKEEAHVGFIAEDVPDLVAAKDRKTLSAMDIVSVLTKVTQEQQKLLEQQQDTINQLKKEIEELKKK